MADALRVGVQHAGADCCLPPPLQTIFFIEGGGQTGFDTCWGNGFVTDYNLINQYGLSDPNPFFQTLLTKPYRNKVRPRRCRG